MLQGGEVPSQSKFSCHGVKTNISHRSILDRDILHKTNQSPGMTSSRDVKVFWGHCVEGR
jgi:hypothetical protein